MMENSRLKNIKAGCIYSLLLLSFVILLFSCDNKRTQEIILVRYDTISLYDPQYGKFLEHIDDKNYYEMIPKQGLGNEVKYYDPDERSLMAIFPLDVLRKGTSRYVVANSQLISNDSLIVNFLWEDYFFLINSKGEILDTMPIVDVRKNKNEYLIHWFLDMRKIPNKQDQYILQTTKKTSSYKFSPGSLEDRIKTTYGVGPFVRARINNSTMELIDEIGRYPSGYYRDDKRINRVWPTFVVNDNQVVYIFPEIDSLFITNLSTNKTATYPIGYLRERRDMENFDYYMNISYDIYRNLYYLIYLPAIKKKDSEGFLINPLKRPWELIVLNKDFEVINKFDISKEYSKHNLIICKSGLMIPNYSLTEKNDDKIITLELFKIEPK